MIPELGHFALILALCVCLGARYFPLMGAHNGRREWSALARPAAQVSFLMLGIICSPVLELLRQRFLSESMSQRTPIPNFPRFSLWRSVGWARRLSSVMGFDALWVDRSGCAVFTHAG
jgi:hypothetical protein